MYQNDALSRIAQLQALLSRCQCDSDTEASIHLQLQSAFADLKTTIATLQQELYQERTARQQAENAKMLLDMTIESAADGILAIDSQGKILSINQTFRQQWNIEASVLSKDIRLIEQVAQLLVEPNLFRRQIQLETEQPTIEGHNLLYLKDGRILERFSKPLWLNNTLWGRVISMRDITEQSHTQKSLIASEKLLRTVVINTPTILYALDKNGVYTLCEGKGLETFGVQPGVLVGQSIYEFYRDYPQVIRDFDRVLQGEEHRSILEFGGAFYDNRATPIRSTEGEVIGLIGVATDVTAQRQAEIELQQTKQDLEIRVELRTVELRAANAKLQKEVSQRRLIEQNLREKQRCLQILNQISQGVAAGLSVNELIKLTTDQTAQQFPDLRVLYSIIENRRFKVIHSVQPPTMPSMQGEVERFHLTPFYFEMMQRREPAIVEDVLSDPAFASMSTDMLSRRTRAIAMVAVQHSTHEIGILALNAPYAKPWTSSEVEVLQELGDYLSIVLQKVQAQEDRQAAEERLKLFESVVVNGNDAVIITDADLETPKITYVNAAFEQMTGYSAEEVIGETATILTQGERKGEKINDALIKRIKTALSHGRSIRFELMNYRVDGSEYWADLNVVPIANLQGKVTHFVAVQRDITDRKYSEKALIATQARLKYLLSSSPAVIYTCQPDRHRACTFVSENITQQLGYEVWQYLKDPQFWIDHIHPEDRSFVLEHLRNLPQAGEITCEYRFLHHDGSYRWLRDSMKWLSDQSIEVIGSVVDISERKWAENKIRASLQEKEVMLKEIHHRVKNNLQVVSSLLKLQAGHIQDQQIIEVFKESQNRVSAMALIHEKLYQSEDLAKTHFSEYIHGLTNALFRSYSANARSIQLHLDVEDVRLSIDTAIPCGLIINELISNSLKYAFPFGEAGTISVQLHAEENFYNDLREFTRYQLVVRDNGRGFPPNLDFRQTKSLGLQLVCMLIRQLRGEINLNLESGVQFTISFTEQKLKV
ncbi:PAS domain S-box protein [Leptolyngbya sp. FACHB-17]|uniref:PAS domain S-box protein n=1 Tax=unclassified Leptolyngbya TaxID=2650499 RepID=UPI001681B958|nr:PAS domain S-box protein [Leptolyngbya sp. FACHB-17]MBD2079254.1 PAS domain S-box protein [Leptolyngbya sp. FACHB-17]